MFKLKLLLSFTFLLGTVSAINGAERRFQVPDLWQDWSRATLWQKVGIGIALVTGYESFLPKQEVKVASSSGSKSPISQPASSPTSVTGLFSRQAGSMSFGEIVQEIKLEKKPEVRKLSVIWENYQEENE